jgi:hypothetical protein
MKDKNNIRILVACEYSGTVRDAFRAEGFANTWSCDLLPTEKPGLHYQGDVLNLLDGWAPVRHQYKCDSEENGVFNLSEIDTGECSCYGPSQEEELEYLEHDGQLFARPKDNPNWDLMICHPPCQNLACSGAKHFAAKIADGRQQASVDFFMKFVNSPAKYIAIENPIGVMSTKYRKPDCIIQPYEHGHEATKTTCLWLKNLPKITPTNIVNKGNRHITKSGKSLPLWYHQAAGKKDRWKIRSATFQGIADAMAKQWGEYILTN